MLILDAASTANGSAYSFYTTPSLGVKNSKTSVVGSGLPPNTEFQLLFGHIQIGIYTTSPEGTVNISFVVPLASPANYPVSAKATTGITFAVTSFSVVAKLPTPSPTASASAAPSTKVPQQTHYSPPSATPTSHVNPIITLPPFSFNPYTPKPAEGDISTLTIIGIIAVATVAVIIPFTFLIRRRRGPEPVYEEERKTPTGPAPTYPPRTPLAPKTARYTRTSTYTQYSSRNMPSRPGMPSRYGQVSAASIRVCPRCRRTVWVGSNTCPYCNQRVR